METYTGIKKRHQDEFNQFPICFAFSENQLKRALEKLNAETKDCISVGAGGFMLKSDYPAFKELRARHELEMKEFFMNDDSMISAIQYELGNHEYLYTWDITDTVRALGLDMADKRTAEIFETARKRYLELNADNF